MKENATIDATAAIQQLLATATHIRSQHELLINEWQPDAPPLTIVFSSAGRALCSQISNLLDPEIATLWQAVERLIVHGDSAVKNAVTTGLLELVLGEASAGRFDMKLITKYLGPETKAYCKAWDEFTGCKTLGIL